MTAFGSSARRRPSADEHQVLFYLYTGDDWPPCPAETVAARPVAPFVVQITGVPLFAYDISRGDLVAVTHDGGQFIGRHVKQRSGHSTVRVVGPPISELFTLAIELRALGADVVLSDDPILLAVDVPPDVDLAGVRALVAGATSVWCTHEVSSDRHNPHADAPRGDAFA